MKSTQEGGQAPNWQFSMRSLIAWGVTAIILVIIGLTITQRSVIGLRPWLGFLVIFFFQALLTYMLAISLKESPTSWKTRVRLSFILSITLVWFLLILSWTSSTDNSIGFVTFSFLMILAVLGGFCGSLAVTAVEMGLWENNSPPGADIEAEVFRLHQERIGCGNPTPWTKRTFDWILAALGILITAPIWIIVICLVWLEDPGPLMFVKNSVGRGGANFRQFKLRTMVRGAEENTGPILADEVDWRVLKTGKILRKTALDELPQLINILKGEMSFVGPRPQRTVLVKDYLEYLPEYAERHRVLPGLSGLAQVAGDYYLTPRQKLRFDRLYIRFAGLRYDVLLLFLAFLITFWYRWQAEWDGRLPRRWLHNRTPRI